MNNNVKQIFDIMNTRDDGDDKQNYMYRVPMYQRGYRWGLSQVISLFDDIHRNSIKYAEQLKESSMNLTGYEYCIQPLVLKKENKEGQENTYIVIDGQQRLTTLALIFQALNQLEWDLKPNLSGCQGAKKDEIKIIYDRKKSNNISEIAEKCKSLSLNNVNISYSDIKSQILYEKEIQKLSVEDKINQLINDQDNIDDQYMINNYVYIYLFFKSIVKAETPCEYLQHLKAETRAINYESQRLEQLRAIFKFELSVIWYEPESNDEEGTFEKFNASKVPLTQSELVKALFMNPDNYILAGSKDYSNEAIKVRQVSIGVMWDKIERTLNQADLWFFIPHKDTHNNSRFDALIDMLVYYKILDDSSSKEELKKSIEDAQYSFHQLEKWIKGELDKACSSEEKADIMERWWRRLTDLYEWYYDIYEATTYEYTTEETKISYAIYHRISLLQLIQEYYFTKITNGNKNEKYIDAIVENHEIYVKLNEVSNPHFRDELNKLIVERINKIWDTKNPLTCFKNEADKKAADSLEKKIRALQYKSDNILMRVFQVIFSLDILEETVGSFSRFSFRDFSKKDERGKEIWVLEHIFARKTDFGTIEKEKVLKLLSECGWSDYLKYRYEGLLADDVIQNKINIKQKTIDKLNDYLQSGKTLPDRIWETTDDYSADFDELPDDIFYAMIVNFLKDNSMGNMSILQVGENTGVGNKPFLDKQEKVKEYASGRKFIPIGTFNLFNGVYSDKDFDKELWYPIHRKEYLEKMIGKIDNYLKFK